MTPRELTANDYIECTALALGVDPEKVRDARNAALIGEVRDRRRRELLNDGRWVNAGALEVRLS